MAGHGEKAQGHGETGLANVSMLPKRRERPALESAFVRLIATGVGVGVALGAILTSQEVAGWIIGLVIALVAVILSAILVLTMTMSTPGLRTTLPNAKPVCVGMTRTGINVQWTPNSQTPTWEAC